MLMMLLIMSTGCGPNSRNVKPPQINIAVQEIPNDESVASAWYAEEFDRAFGAKAVVLRYDSSMLASSAMSTGNIDIAIVGSATAAIAVSNGLPFEIFWIHNVEGENECLVVKNDSNINSVADLKGKRVAVTFGATTQYSLLLALQQAGISHNDVKIFDMQSPEIIDDWNKGLLDAAFVWQPTLGELLNDGHILLSSRQLNEKNITTADVAVVNKDFARKHPDMVRKYVELQIKAHNLFKDDPKQAANISASTLGISANDTFKQMKEILWIDAKDQITERYLGTGDDKGQIAQTLFETAQFLSKYDVLKHAASLETFKDAVNPSFVEAVAK